MSVRITKKGINVKTNTDPSQWLFNSDYDTYKFLQTLIGSITVTDYGGLVSTFATKVIPIPAQYAAFSPYFFTYLSGSDGNNSYDFNTSTVHTAFVTEDSSGVNLTLTLSYLGSGVASYTITAFVYIFGNAI